MVPFVYNAVVLRWHDGDTGTLAIDLGFSLVLTRPVRIAHINAPELATPTGVLALKYAVEICPPDTAVALASHSLDKYGRVLGSLTLPDGTDFGTLMVQAGQAVPYEGGPK